MNVRSIAYVVGGVVIVVGGGILIDVLIETEEERIEVLLEAITGEVSPEKIDEALRWIDTSRQPVEVLVMGQSELYDDDDTLRQRARASMSRFMGQQLRLMNETITVEDDRATLRIRVISGQLGMVNAEFELRKREDDWLISVVRVTR